jgi:hypothetical protein
MYSWSQILPGSGISDPNTSRATMRPYQDARIPNRASLGNNSCARNGSSLT